jgi:hypothetical protein
MKVVICCMVALCPYENEVALANSSLKVLQQGILNCRYGRATRMQIVSRSMYSVQTLMRGIETLCSSSW